MIIKRGDAHKILDVKNYCEDVDDEEVLKKFNAVKQDAKNIGNKLESNGNKNELSIELLAN